MFYGDIYAAYDRIEICYKRMQKVLSSAARCNNYEQICALLNQFPELNNYWENRIYETRYVNRIAHIRTLTRPPKPIINKIAEPPIVKEKICAYIVYLEDHHLIKVGKSKDFDQRYYNLQKDYGTVIPQYFFYFDNEEDAYIMECVLHKFFKEVNKADVFIPQDRFSYVNITLQDIEQLDQAAEKIRNQNWFF